MNPFLKRKGGKFYSKNAILPYFPKNINTYIEPFLGGGSVFLNLEKAGITIKTGAYLNDLDGDIYSLWKVFYEKNLLTQLIDMLSKFALYSQDCFDYLQDLSPANEIEKIFKLFMLTMLSYQGQGESYYIGIGDINRKMNKIYEAEPYWLKYHDYLVRMNAKISNADFSVFFKGCFNRPESFCYCDPPFFDTSGYDNLPFPLEKHEQLCKCVHNFKGKIALSYNPNEWVYDHYNDMQIITLKTRWAGNIKSEKSKATFEYLILNYGDSQIDTIK
jgi:DNA adenine methylase